MRGESSSTSKGEVEDDELLYEDLAICGSSEVPCLAIRKVGSHGQGR